MLRKPKIKTVTRLVDIPRDFFTENQTIEGLRFVRLVFDARKFTASLIRASTFDHCTFTDCIFDDMDLQRVDFIEC